MPSAPCLADLSLNCVIRPASPKPVWQLSTHASSACSGDVRLDEEDRPLGVDARREVLRRGAAGPVAQHGRVGVDGQRVQVDDAVERVVVLLERDPLGQRAEQVAQVQGVRGGLHPGEDPGSCGQDRVGHRGGHPTILAGPPRWSNRPRVGRWTRIGGSGGVRSPRRRTAPRRARSAAVPDGCTGRVPADRCAADPARRVRGGARGCRSGVRGGDAGRRRTGAVAAAAARVPPAADAAPRAASAPRRPRRSRRRPWRRTAGPDGSSSSSASRTMRRGS